LLDAVEEEEVLGKGFPDADVSSVVLDDELVEEAVGEVVEDVGFEVVRGASSELSEGVLEDVSVSWLETWTVTVVEGTVVARGDDAAVLLSLI
jgi:hypothetical protein